MPRRPARNPATAAALGIALRRLRLDAGLSQENLATRARVHRTFIGLVENGHRDPSVGSVSRVIGALGLTWAEFGEALDRSEGSRRRAEGVGRAQGSGRRAVK
ncbi:MAG: helix-turn-helix transcriptional regulator [Proteobacteria bacterium]|nr:helix-turn-helix transcriptional regulator [Pseudomonadota bacterium]